MGENDMRRPTLRDHRPPLSDPSDPNPASDSLFVRNKKALLRLGDQVAHDPPTVPVLADKAFEVSLADDEDNGTTLRLLGTHNKITDYIQFWATIHEGLEDESVYIPIDPEDDLKCLCNNLMFDYLSDHDDARFFLPVAGARVRKRVKDELPQDKLLLWYWYDVLDLKVVFQIAQFPDAYDDVPKVEVSSLSAERFILNLAPHLEKIVLAQKRGTEKRWPVVDDMIKNLKKQRR